MRMGFRDLLRIQQLELRAKRHTVFGATDQGAPRALEPALGATA
jgi:hypothetical protein